MRIAKREKQFFDNKCAQAAHASRLIHELIQLRIVEVISLIILFLFFLILRGVSRWQRRGQQNLRRQKRR